MGNTATGANSGATIRRSLRCFRCSTDFSTVPYRIRNPCIEHPPSTFFREGYAMPRVHGDRSRALSILIYRRTQILLLQCCLGTVYPSGHAQRLQTSLLDELLKIRWITRQTWRVYFLLIIVIITPIHNS